MKSYELYARKYPAMVGMLLPALLTVSIILNCMPHFQDAVSNILCKISVFVPIVSIYAAIGYLLANCFAMPQKVCSNSRYSKKMKQKCQPLNCYCGQVVNECLLG